MPGEARPHGAVDRIRSRLARADIVLAAIDVFAERGVVGTRIDDLLEAAGVARRTFYKHFRSKDDLLVQLYQEVTHELIAGILAGGIDPSEPLGGLTGALDVYLSFHLDNHAILRVLVEEAMRSESPLAPVRRQFRAALVQALSQAYRTATGRTVDPMVFVAVISALEGLSLELLAGTPDADATARARAVILGVVSALIRSPDVLPPMG